jgi:CRISPR/Cas system Type II protein with McrA/HNH and RuvC-like nuclease domain
MNVMRITSYYLLHDWLQEINHPNKDDFNFILKAERWNFKNFGIGYCSLTKFLDFLDLKRLEKRDNRYLIVLRKQIFIRDNYTCNYCKVVGGILEIDHIIPYSKGGSNDINNLTTACRKCNRQKKDKSVEEFLIWKENKI